MPYGGGLDGFDFPKGDPIVEKSSDMKKTPKSGEAAQRMVEIVRVRSILLCILATAGLAGRRGTDSVDSMDGCSRPALICFSSLSKLI